MSSGGGAGTTGAAGANIPARPNLAADPVLGREHDPNAAARGNVVARSASGVAGGRTADGEAEEHSTWLTEDDMDWGEDDAAEPILGGRPASAGTNAGGDDESTRRDPAPE